MSPNADRSGPHTPADQSLDGRAWLIVLAVFVSTHVIFWLLSVAEGGASSTQAQNLFSEMALDGPLLPALAMTVGAGCQRSRRFMSLA